MTAADVEALPIDAMMQARPLTRHTLLGPASIPVTDTANSTRECFSVRTKYILYALLRAYDAVSMERSKGREMAPGSLLGARGQAAGPCVGEVGIVRVSVQGRAPSAPREMCVGPTSPWRRPNP